MNALEPYRQLIPSRPPLRWHGSKWLLAPWIIEHMPLHRVFVEPFGGGASVLLRNDAAKFTGMPDPFSQLDPAASNIVFADDEKSGAVHDAPPNPNPGGASSSFKDYPEFPKFLLRAGAAA